MGSEGSKGGEDMAVGIDRIREISQVANQYLCDHVGDAVSGGTPTQESEASDWSVPIFCDTNYGHLRCGSVLIDKAGNVVSAPTRIEIDSTVRRLKEKLADA